jgi:hypothetical protein
MTLNDLVLRIKDRSHKGDPTVTTDTITAQIIRALMDARRELVRKVPKQYLRVDATTPLSLVNPTVLYSLAPDVLAPIIFRYTFNNVEYLLMRIESEREFYQNLFIRSQGPNRPYYYVEKGFDTSGNRQIEVYPIPLVGTTFTTNYSYYKDPTRTDLTTADLATTFPDFPSYMLDAVWKGGLFHFLKNFDDQMGQELAEKDYEKASLAIDEVNEADQDMELQMRWGVIKNRGYHDQTTGIRLI